jgi:hypothetical protein
MISAQTIIAKILSILGVSHPFAQGGSLRLTIPKRMVEKYGLTKKKDYFGFIFVDTDRGVLLVPLDKAVNPDSIRGALNFMDLSHITAEDLEFLFEEE